MAEARSGGTEVRIAELFGALGLFADFADGFPPGKVVRTTVLAMGLARSMQASSDELHSVYFATLLRYAGCVGFSHEEAHEFGGGDDLSVRNTMSMADPTNPLGTMRDIVLNVGRGMPIALRARGVVRLLSDPSAIRRHSQAQCETSLWLARLVRSREPVVRALEQICERYDGRGAPRGTAGNDLSFAIRVSHVADIAEIAFHRGGLGAAIEEVKRRSGKQLDPVLAHALVGRAKELFEPLAEATVWDAYLACEPGPFATADGDEVDLLARAFGALADLKSVYTVGHSSRVARLARAAAESLGLDPIALERAGHLHDVGRVAVPNDVWDRPGPLDRPAWERVRMHSYFTERILRRAGCLSAIASLAAAAHERLDGDGYPKGLDARALDPAANVLAAADVLAALGEDRPHRPALSVSAARDTLAEMASSQRLSKPAVDAVLAAAGLASPQPIDPRRGGTEAHGLTPRELQVVRWIARGKSNREIGELLSISPRTVQNHIAHVYDKLGLYSRAGATLWAVERGLLA